MPPSLAARTREAIEGHPFLVAALRADVVNYTAAARFLGRENDLEGDVDAIATALRRYAEELPARETERRDVRVRMERGVDVCEGESRSDGAATLLSVGDIAIEDGGGRTAIVATGDIDASALAGTLRTLSVSGIEPDAAAVGRDTLLVVVDRLEGADAVRAVEDALERVRVPPGDD
ncbi:DUF7523 family protein [Halobiforma nitratireducens]|uniref:ACT domain-containing protein n=1 Tax=Halobiforma nitratireducens JCM 10879 TaxID=1227454 RepID=M0LX29_9EURY|nr:hypothetical protein [Halobiforma nitratireducens]EMA36660.1 hypothetical protein C446_11477 [Halobiforma nitratireducens JCM 10879]